MREYNMSVGVISVVYEEPEWQQTKKCIERLDLPTIYVDRGGVGSLAKSYNQGFNELLKAFPDLQYVWMISNVTFHPGILKHMLQFMDTYDCIHPSFNSDHRWTRPFNINVVKPVPFVEFTAPLVKVETFKKFPLDEKMPYWGHDLDWGYRVRQAGGLVGVDYGVSVNHEYIRYKVRRKPLPVTQKRQQLRKETDKMTEERLVELYGENWGKVLGSEIH